jgi:hypothetical protein
LGRERHQVGRGGAFVFVVHPEGIFDAYGLTNYFFCCCWLVGWLLGILLVQGFGDFG